MTADVPSTSPWYPVCGSALPATSGTPRPAEGTPTPDCPGGCSEGVLAPPPVALLAGSSFHTVSAEIERSAPSSRRVPPHAITFGLDAGTSQWSLPSVPPSVLP